MTDVALRRPDAISSLEFQRSDKSAPGVDRRIVALDGVRGMMTIMVVLSHYFGELDHGVRATKFGWIAVNMFFVLSGFLIMRLILEKKGSANFFQVFYVRRVLRTVPAYLISVVVCLLIISSLHAAWVDGGGPVPYWSYIIFFQTFAMVGAGHIGLHWLAPTWTIALEEHFYLVAPALVVFTPRRWLTPALVAMALTAVALRVAVYYFGLANELAALILFPSRADILVCGMLAAVALRNERIDWSRYDLMLRLAPLVALVVVGGLKLVSAQLFGVLAPLVVAAGSAGFLLAIVRGAPEAERFKSKTLRFFGDNSYCLYLTHLPILGLAHGLLLNARPDLASPAQWLVTLATLPVCVAVGWGMTTLVERPLTTFGRRWRWSTEQGPGADRSRSAARGETAGAA